MIEGGGLGIYTPEEVGPMSFQVPNGVVDILVKDDEEAVDTAKKYLSYFQGSIDHWEAHDQGTLRHIVPENRSEMYDMQDIIETIAGPGVDPRDFVKPSAPASSPPSSASKASRWASSPTIRIIFQARSIVTPRTRLRVFLQLCDAFDLPVLSLMDCPGIMVGPEYERTALLRHSARMFVTGANMTTPMFGVVVRKAYGMGVRAMCGGSSAGALLHRGLADSRVRRYDH